MSEGFAHLELLKKQLVVMAMSALPLIELKGAIPTGIGLGLDKWTAFISAYIGSLLPVPFLLLFFRSMLRFLFRKKFFSKFAKRLEGRIRKKGVAIRKYSLLGIFLFVALPLPTTGVWTGAMIASFLDLRIKHAFPVIAAGNLVAGMIVMLISYYVM